MRNEKLRKTFESLGFTHVETVIASGNVLFETRSKNIKKLELDIEKTLLKQLGFTSTTIIRSKEEIASLIKKNPFKGLVHGPSSSLNITFLKSASRKKVAFPYHAPGYRVLGSYDRALASVVDLTGAKTPDLMRWMEKGFGKEITTRTWKTVERLHKKLAEY